MANPFRTLQPSIETACTRFPTLLNAQQIKIEEASGTPEKKSPIPSSGLLASRRAALGQDRASMAILER